MGNDKAIQLYQAIPLNLSWPDVVFFRHPPGPRQPITLSLHIKAAWLVPLRSAALTRSHRERDWSGCGRAVKAKERSEKSFLVKNYKIHLRIF
jgi:hypothetical protein